jgi:hypothetical protein
MVSQGEFARTLTGTATVYHASSQHPRIGALPRVWLRSIYIFDMTSLKERVMALSEVIQPNKVRLPWSLRGKVEIGPLQLVGQNALGLPYVQGQIRNRSGRPLHLKIVVRVLNEQRQPIFAGSPGILDVFDLDAQQQRAFRISLRDEGNAGQLDRQRLWVTRSGVELSIEG